MCTVLFIPKDNSVYFASLRDENPLRPKAIEPRKDISHTIQFLAPRDAFAGGTWIGVNEFNNVIILLNGGFENHIKQCNYKKSRGLIVVELLQSELPVIDWNLMDLTDIEPFTLVIWSDNNLFQLVWDGQNKHKNLIDSTVPHIWSSSTLYNQSAKENRRQLFINWAATDPVISQISLLNFFKSFVNNENGFIMNRTATLRTLSYSFLEIQNNDKAIFNYFDFSNLQNTYSTFKIQNTFNSIIENSKPINE
jgi:Transport and Golgi organisation 2